MNVELQFAKVILDVQQLREESYCEKNGTYKLEITECLKIAAKRHDLSNNLRDLLSLAFSWWNDLRTWAEKRIAESETQ